MHPNARVQNTYPKYSASILPSNRRHYHINELFVWGSKPVFCTHFSFSSCLELGPPKWVCECNHSNWNGSKSLFFLDSITWLVCPSLLPIPPSNVLCSASPFLTSIDWTACNLLFRLHASLQGRRSCRYSAALFKWQPVLIEPGRDAVCSPKLAPFLP